MSQITPNQQREIRKEYFNWLCRLADPKQSYGDLLHILFNKEFKIIIPNDENRAAYGITLRERFSDLIMEEHPRGIDNPVAYFASLNGPCNMLELILGLAISMDDILYEPEQGDRISVWFWELIKNIGLENMHNAGIYNQYGGIAFIDDILDKLINREYKRDGRGGFFPLKHPTADQRNVEIWDQMNHYIMENYTIDGEL